VEEAGAEANGVGWVAELSRHLTLAANDMRSLGRRAMLWGLPALLLWVPCHAQAPHPIPLIDGLTVMTSFASEDQGDYEVVTALSDLSPTSFKLTVSGEAPDDSGEVREITVSRLVLREDWRNARIMRRRFHEFDARQFPGTTPEFPAVGVNEIRALGHTAITYLEIESEFGATVIARTMTGSLARVANGPAEITVLVNGRPQTLRVLHVAGRLADDGDGDDFDYVVLDDPDYPLILRGRGPGFSSAVTRIEFPQPTTAATSLERSLAEQKHALVYGIYFKFARADIRPVSEPILKEIAAILKNNPSWKLSIVGHTDGIGVDRANLDLSRRRAQSVKTALVERYAIEADRLTTGGFGASQPQAKNDTPEGRARNRRVELTRQ
jgi:outer membrane protein OmpA-like peptidoglycan-associated protein